MNRNNLLKLHLFGSFALLSGGLLLILVLLTTLSLGLAGGSKNPDSFGHGFLSLAAGLCLSSILTSFGLQFLQQRETNLDGPRLRLHWTACLLGTFACLIATLILSPPLATISSLALLGLWLIRSAVIQLSYS